MTTVDIIFLVLTLGSLAIGAFSGFGGVLKNISDGLFGKIFAFILTYVLFGVVLNFGFVSELLNSMVTALSENGSWWASILLAIRIELIAFAVALYFIIRLIQKLIVSAIAGIVAMPTPAMNVLNRVGGALLSFVNFLATALIIFQIAAWIDGTEGAVYTYLSEGIFGLEHIFVNNPLNSLVETVKMSLGALGGE